MQYSEYVFADGDTAGQTLTSRNNDGTWTAAVSVDAGVGSVSGTVTFTGPAGKSRQMGMCLVQRFETNADGAVCDNVHDCASAPALLPPGGSRYCVPDGVSGPSYCHVRPGPRGDYCIGSPASQLAAISPGTYRINHAAKAGTQWRAMACFEACVDTPHAVSQAATVR